MLLFSLLSSLIAGHTPMCMLPLCMFCCINIPTEDAPLPDDWTELVDEATGKHVYYNTMNGNISFDRPEGGDRE